MDERLMMRKLREILLVEDRNELQQLKQVLDDPVILSQKVTPLIEERLNFLKKNFPIEFQLAVEKIVEQKLEASREELLDIIYPVLGQMIKKYIQRQFQLLKESLEIQLRNTLQKGIIGRLRFVFFGAKPKEMSAAIISQMDKPRIEEIFVIEQHSGILLGSASINETIDLDMIAGMLTAIKAFAEDTFNKGAQRLEGIQYGTYSLVLENFNTFYVAAAISGSISAKEKSELSDDLIKFVQKELRVNLKKKDGSSHFEIQQKLERHFFQPQMVALSQNNNTHTQ